MHNSCCQKRGPPVRYGYASSKCKSTQRNVLSMDYIENFRYEQLPLLFGDVAPAQEYLLVSSSLTGFHNTDTTSELLTDGRRSLCMNGTLSLPEERICPFCGKQKRLEDAGDYEAARSLKRSRHILMSSRATLERKTAKRARGRPSAGKATSSP